LKHLRNKLKIIVLGTNPVMFNRKLSKGKYTPLIIDFDIGLILNSNDGFDKSFFFKTYQERYLFKHIYRKFKGIRYKPTREIVNDYNGHLKFYNQIKNTDWIHSYNSIRVNDINLEQVKYFIKTIELFHKHNIEIIIVNPPIWHIQMETIAKEENFKKFKGIIDTISEKFHIKIYNSDFKLFKKELSKDCYLNAQHLNYNGSKIFTNHFCEYLNTISLQ